MAVYRVHVCTGGTLDVLPVVGQDDVLIGVDGGAIRLLEAGLIPDVAVGDFDTCGPEGVARLEKAGVPLRRFPVEKDATDSELALETAVSYRPREIVFYGALGSRMDHTWANVHLLWKAHQSGVWARIEGGHNRILLLSERFPSFVVAKDRFAFVSLLPLLSPVGGVTLRGFRYPLQNALLHIGSTLGVSNQLLGENGEISITSGALLVILSMDVP